MNIHESLSCLLLSLAEAKLHASSSCSREREEGKKKKSDDGSCEQLSDRASMTLKNCGWVMFMNNKYSFWGLWELDLVLAFGWDLPLLVVGCFSLA